MSIRGVVQRSGETETRVGKGVIIASCWVAWSTDRGRVQAPDLFMNRPVVSLGGRLLPDADIGGLPKTTQDQERRNGGGARGISDSASLGQPVEARNAWVSPGKDGEEGPKGEDQRFRQTKETYGGTAASARRLFLSKAERGIEAEERGRERESTQRWLLNMQKKRLTRKNLDAIPVATLRPLST